MRKLEVKIRQIIWALKQSLKPTTGDFVFYKGSVYYIKSSLTGENIWDLFKGSKTEPVHRHINGYNLKIKHSAKRFIHVFKNHLKFQNDNWKRIDYANPLGKRLSYNNSDDIYFRRGI